MLPRSFPILSSPLCLPSLELLSNLTISVSSSLKSTMSSRAASPSPIASGQHSPTSKVADSGYDSGANSDIGLPDIYFTKPHLQFINRQLQFLEPPDILRWAVTTLPHLFQTTAFGLSGLVTLDMLSKMKIPRPQMVDVVFHDTLHHFSETLDLVERIRTRYPLVNVHVYKPEGVETSEEFAVRYGDKLWETEGERYDFLVKVEPSQRAYRELGVQAVLTGRRRSQGGKRGDLPIIEVDDGGLIKINPMANWSFQQIREYIKEHDGPYNILIEQGYKRIGDWHSTQPVQEGEDERAGRG